MAPTTDDDKLVFQCTACGKILTTVKGLEHHNKNLHNNCDVRYGDYELIFQKTGQAVYNSDDKGRENIGDNKKLHIPEFQVKSKFKTPLRQQNSSLPSFNDAIEREVRTQVDIVRELKTANADKPAIDDAAKTPIGLEADAEIASDKDGKPTAKPEAASKKPHDAASVELTGPPMAEINAAIIGQGKTVRKLKAVKADKAVIGEAVKKLLAFKVEFKAATGVDWKPTKQKKDGKGKVHEGGGESQSEIESVQQRIEKMTHFVNVIKVASKVAPESSELDVALGTKSKPKGNRAKKGPKKEGGEKTNPKGPKYNYFEGFSMSKISLEPLDFGWGKKAPQKSVEKNTQQRPGNNDVGQTLGGCLVATVDTMESSSMLGKKLITSQQLISGLSKNTSNMKEMSRPKPGVVECLISPTKGGEGVGEDRLKEVHYTGEDKSMSSITDSVKPSNTTVTPGLKIRKSKQRKGKSRLICEDPKCLPCSILENCKICYFCIHRSKLKQKCQLRQCYNLNSRTAKKTSKIPVCHENVVVNDVTAEVSSEDQEILDSDKQQQPESVDNLIKCSVSEEVVLEVIEDMLITVVANPNTTLVADSVKTFKQYEPRPKIHPCKYCDKKFFQFKSALAHIRSCRDPEKLRFVCDICLKAFVNKSSVKRHMTVHIRDKTKETFRCDVCEITFSTKHKMKFHNISKHGLAPTPVIGDYNCPIEGCDFKHVKEAFVKAHVTLLHKTKNKLNCSICPFQCYSRSGMAKHMTSVHIVSSSDIMVLDEMPGSSDTHTVDTLVSLDLDEIADMFDLEGNLRDHNIDGLGEIESLLGMTGESQSYEKIVEFNDM